MLESIFLIALAYAIMLGLAFSHAKLWVEFKALQKSTHQVQFVNNSSEFEEITEALKKKLTVETDNL